MKTVLAHTFEEIVSIQNLCEAWREFVRSKQHRRDVQLFSRQLVDFIVPLHEELTSGTYRHGGYHHFRVQDPKPRDIHKASVRDRIVHHAVYRALYPFFSAKFIADSYSCQEGKGTHRAIERFAAFARKVSYNNTRTCWVLKCDIRKFFASIDHVVLLSLLRANIPDHRTMALLQEVIGSFSWGHGKGLPLGNLTSQLFVNIYMNPFDQFVKHQLKARRYIRYADDFVFMSEDRQMLEDTIPLVSIYLADWLHLTLHPDKVSIETLASGVDFLGWVNFPNHRVLRTVTKKRMFRRIAEHTTDATVSSYLGLFGHGNTFKLKQEVLDARFLLGGKSGDS